MENQRIDIGAEVDRAGFGALQIGVVLLCCLVTLLDGFDTQSIAYTGPAIALAFGLPTGGLAPILTAGTAGMTLGAMGLGLFGDRVGRRPAVLAAVGLFGIATLGVSVASSTTEVAALRFLAGLGMGGATPVLLTLAAEYAPSRLRGAIMTLVLLGLPAGAICGGLLASHWLPAIGWRGIFVVGGVTPLVLLLVLAVLLPDSPSLLASLGGPARTARAKKLLARIVRRPVAADAGFLLPARAQKASIGQLLAPGLRRTTLAIWATYLLNWVAWYMFLLWLPTALTRGGMPVTTAALATVTINSVFIAAAVPLAAILPRLDPRHVLAAIFAFGVAVCLGLAAGPASPQMLFVLIGAGGLGIGGQQIALNYLAASAYPTTLRATGTGWAIGMGRVGSVIGSATGGFFLQAYGETGFYLALALPLALGGLAVTTVRLQGRKSAADGAALAG